MMPTPAPMLTSLREVQFLKARSPMDLTLSGIVTLSSVLLSSYTYAPIAETSAPPSCVGTVIRVSVPLYFLISAVPSLLSS